MEVKKISKKELKNTVNQVMSETLIKLDVSSPSKKTKKLLESISKKLSVQIKSDLKKKHRDIVKQVRLADKKKSQAA